MDLIPIRPIVVLSIAMKLSSNQVFEINKETGLPHIIPADKGSFLLDNFNLFEGYEPIRLKWKALINEAVIKARLQCDFPPGITDAEIQLEALKLYSLLEEDVIDFLGKVIEN